MEAMRTVCLVDARPALAAAMERAGHTVLALKTDAVALFHLPSALERAGVTPDLVVQVESLASRTLLTGLDQVECPLIFWAVDPHLNAHWHGAYARLFDVVCSTQRASIPDLKRHGAEDVRWLPSFGSRFGWVDMAERAHDIGFVGRVTSQRPARRWLLEFLAAKGAEHSLAIEDGLTFSEMIALYRTTRIIPNESIFGEVNFRLFEGASCGCMVLSQALGDEQESLFEPGREFDTYADVVELDDKLTRYLANPRLLQAMGRAARERVLAEHLPVHRAERLLEIGGDAARRRTTGSVAGKWTALSAAALWESGGIALDVDAVLRLLGSVEPDALVEAAFLRTLATAGKRKKVRDRLAVLLTSGAYAGHELLDFTASMAALKVKDFQAAVMFWHRAGLMGGTGLPSSPEDLLSRWAKVLQRRGMALRKGVGFDPGRNLPGSAFECLLWRLDRQPGHVPTLKQVEALLRPVTGLELMRAGYLSMISLRERDQWRPALEGGVANLRAYRLESGLEEVALALSLAREAGEESHCLRALKGRDPSGLIAARLGL